MKRWMVRMAAAIITVMSTVSVVGLPSSEAALLGGPIGISQGVPGQETYPAVAYGAADNRYLVVWEDNRNQGTTDSDIYGQFVNADGTPAGTAFPISTATAVQTRPAIAYSTASGRYLVLWADFRDESINGIDLYGQVIEANGALVGGNVAISTAANDQNRPAIAYDPVTDRYLVVWQDGRDFGVAFSRNDVYGQLIESDGALVGGNFPISTGPTDQDRPEVAYQSTFQRFFVVWTDFRDNATSGGDIIGQFVGTDGSLVGGRAPVSTAPADQFRPNLAYDADADVFLVVWTDCRNAVGECDEGLRIGTDIYGQVVGAFGRPIGDSIPIEALSSPAYRPAVSFSPVDRLFEVIWPDERNLGTSGIDLLRQAVSPDGTRLGMTGSVSLAPGQQHRSDITYNPTDNRLFVVFHSTEVEPGDIMGQFLNVSRLVGAEIVITTIAGEEKDPTVGHSALDNQYLALWADSRNLATTGQDIFVQALGADGALIGPNLPLSTAVNVQKAPAVAYGTAGNRFLAVWGDRRTGGPDDVYGQAVGSDGSVTGADFLVAQANGVQGEPALAYDPPHDRFLVVWTEERNKAVSGRDIYGVFVNPDGTLATGAFVINAATTDQFQPAVAHRNGRYLVTWTDCRQSPGTCTQRDPVGTTIVGQLVGDNGSILGGSFVISSVVADHRQSAVAYNAVNDEFLVVWQDGRNVAVSGVDVFGQRVASEGSLLGGNFLIAGASRNQTAPTVAHSSLDNQYLVVWEDQRNGASSRTDIYGQAVAADGTLLAENLAITAAPGVQRAPAVVWNAVDNEYLVVWLDARVSRFDIYGQRVTLSP